MPSNADRKRDSVTPKTVIIGGGISGLAAAYALQKSEGLGRQLSPARSLRPPRRQDRHLRRPGLPHRRRPRLLHHPEARGPRPLPRARPRRSAHRLQHTATPTTYVLSKGRLHPMPEGMMLMAPTMVLPFLRSKLISWPGKLRMGMEIFIGRNTTDADESLGRLRPPPPGHRNARQNRRPADGRHPRRRPRNAQPAQHLPHVHGDGEEARQPGPRHDEAQESASLRTRRPARARRCS